MKENEAVAVESRRDLTTTAAASPPLLLAESLQRLSVALVPCLRVATTSTEARDLLLFVGGGGGGSVFEKKKKKGGVPPRPSERAHEQKKRSSLSLSLVFFFFSPVGCSSQADLRRAERGLEGQGERRRERHFDFLF